MHGPRDETRARRSTWGPGRDLYLDLSYFTSYDSQPPASATALANYGIVLGVAYKF